MTIDYSIAIFVTIRKFSVPAGLQPNLREDS